MSTVPTVRLNNGVDIPQLGLGTARVDDEEIRRIVREALQIGYRFIDTAAKYENEVGVGQGLADVGLDRDDVFVSTKLRGSDQGYDSAKQALTDSLQRLGLEHVDLYLVHWPLPRLDRYLDSWRALQELAAEGLTRAIGVSNFLPEHLDRLAEQTSTIPAVNQIEIHPRLPQLAQRADDARRGIVTEAWSPLANGGDLLADDVVTGIADAHEVTPGQVVLRWHVQQGLVTFPKASSTERLRANLDVFGFELSEAEMSALAALETGERTDARQDPATWEEF